MSKMYVALDFPTWQETDHFLKENDLVGVPVKVGMELFYREGISVIEQLKENNHDIFLDLKLFDIPTTVGRAMANLAKLNIDMVNVHALGGSDMIKRAKEGLMTANHETKLIAVTLLTSFDQATVTDELRLPATIEDNVVHLSKLSHDSGADGVVCSVHEVEAIKAACGEHFQTVTPGIRLAESNDDDQKRVATPQQAREIGSDYIVVGRSITKADNPNAAYYQCLKEWHNE